MVGSYLEVGDEVLIVSWDGNRTLKLSPALYQEQLTNIYLDECADKFPVSSVILGNPCIMRI